MTVNDTETATSALPSSDRSDDELDGTPESIISDTTTRGRSGYGSHVRYKLMKYFTTSRHDLIYDKQNDDLCSPYLLHSKKECNNTPISVNRTEFR